MVVVGQAVGVHEMAVARADLPGFGIHQLGESVNGAARCFSQSFGGVIA